MLNKNEIINGLKNEEFIVRNAVYEYVCNLHLYDNVEINEALVDFLIDNYEAGINFAGLVYSKLNEKLIQLLVQLHKKTRNEFIKESIEKVLVSHYSLLREIELPSEFVFQNEEYLLMYRKMKHFSTKDPSALFDLYLNAIDSLEMEDDFEEDDIEEADKSSVQEILVKAMGEALIQTEKGALILITYAMTHATKEEAKEEFYETYMPYMIYPLCHYADELCYPLIQNIYLNYMDFLEYAKDCNYYFSNICDEAFLQDYIKILKSKNVEDYDYDICEYLNSEKIDSFLMEQLKKTKDKTVKENIIRILASKFTREIIPEALDFLGNKTFENEEAFRYAVVPLLEFYKNEDISNSFESKNTSPMDEELEEMLMNMLNGVQNERLKNEPHIREYRRIRKIHDEIMQSMVNYYEKGIFKPKFEKIETSGNIAIVNTEFETSTELGAQALANLIVYKNASNMSCITEDFIQKNKFQKEEKKKFLQSMLESHAGLFEIPQTDRKNGKVQLVDVLSGKEFWITDVGLSSNLHNEKIYLYTRIITYQDISFGTGLNLFFDKENPFIQKWIKENKEKYNEKPEFTRFLELYQYYLRDKNRVKRNVTNI